MVLAVAVIVVIILLICYIASFFIVHEEKEERREEHKRRHSPKRRKRRNHKVAICYLGKSQFVPKDELKKFLSKGATKGRCVPFRFPFMVVTNFNNSELLIFDSTDSGSTFPFRVIAGSNTQLSLPVTAHVDRANEEIVTANFTGQSITVYSEHSSGNAAPLRMIAGGNTQLAFPGVLALDQVNGDYYVTSNNNQILVFPHTANGNVAPSRVITSLIDLPGAASGTGAGLIVSMDVNAFWNEIYIGGLTPPTYIAVFNRTANGASVPLRVINGPATQLDAPVTGIQLDAIHDELFELTANGKILVFNRTDNGNTAP